MNNINFTNKINLPIIGEVDLNGYFINSISMENNYIGCVDIIGCMDIIGRDIVVNHILTIKNDYFEFKILYIKNRIDKEILYLFDIFKQLTKYEIDFRHYDELQKVIEDRYCGGYVYKYDEEWIDYNYKKWKIYEEIKDILRHLQDEFYIESDIEFNKEYSSKKNFTIGLQK